MKCKDTYFSLSGVQNKVQEYFAATNDPAAAASYALRSVVHAVRKATENAWKLYPGLPIVFSGGVSANSLLREVMQPLGAVFAEPQYSTDNAMGSAILTYRLEEA